MWSFALWRNSSIGSHIMLSQHVLSPLLHCTSLNLALSIEFQPQPFTEPSEVPTACQVTLSI